VLYLRTYQKLIDIYEGNPRYLQIVGHLIQDLFAGDTNKFLQLQQPSIDIDLMTFLRQTLDGLSSLETEILKFIASQSGIPGSNFTGNTGSLSN
jgi:hypothetical protein